jgi:hypothetical protein
MTDYEPWAGHNFHEAMAAKPMERDRSELTWLVYRKGKCIAAFPTEEAAKEFKGRKHLKIKKIPSYIPIPD